MYSFHNLFLKFYFANNLKYVIECIVCIVKLLERHPDHPAYIQCGQWK